MCPRERVKKEVKRLAQDQQKSWEEKSLKSLMEETLFPNAKTTVKFVGKSPMITGRQEDWLATHLGPYKNPEDYLSQAPLEKNWHMVCTEPL